MKWINTRYEHPPFYKLLIGYWKEIEEDGIIAKEKELSIFYCTYSSGRVVSCNRDIRGSHFCGTDLPNKWSEFEVPEDYPFHYDEKDVKTLKDIYPDLNWQESCKVLKYLNLNGEK